MKTQILLHNGYAYEIEPCRDEHEHGAALATLEEFENTVDLTEDSGAPCINRWLVKALPYDETGRYGDFEVAFYVRRDCRGRYDVQPIRSFADRGAAYAPNATLNGRRVYAERLESPLLGFTYRTFEAQPYGSKEQFARFDEVRLDVPFTKLAVYR